MVMQSPERHKIIADAATRESFSALLSLSREAKEKQDHVDYYCRAIAHTRYQYDREFDIDEYVTNSVVDFLGLPNADFEDGIKTIDQTADLLHRINPEILRRYDSKGFRGKVGRMPTKSNLRYEVLAEIVSVLAVEDYLIEVDQEFVDSRLRDKRNFIAHGQSVPVTAEELETSRITVSRMMRSFKDRLMVAATSEEYRA